MNSLRISYLCFWSFSSPTPPFHPSLLLLYLPRLQSVLCTIFSFWDQSLECGCLPRSHTHIYSKPILPFPEAKAPQLGVCACGPLTAPALRRERWLPWSCVDLVWQPPLPWEQEGNSLVMSQIRCFTMLLPDLWLWWFFHPIFRDDPWGSKCRK